MSKAPDVGALLANAPGISAQSVQALTVVDIGQKIQAALGTPPDQVEATEAVLALMLMDDSGSIRFAGNSEAVRDGHNKVLADLRGSKQSGAVLVHTRYLNGQVLYPFCPLDHATEMDTSNYNPNGGTPLYDESLVVLGLAVVKVQEFADNGVPARAVTLIVTDGHDEHSRRARPQDVKALVREMLGTERHIVAAMGIDDGGRTDFREVFREMGIPDQWILTPKNTPTEVRRAFGTFSQSAVRASQSARSFSQTAAGGFGTP